MAKKTPEMKKLTRRGFVKGAGAVLAFGAVTNLGACAPAGMKKASQPVLEGVPGSARIVHDPNVCAGCGVCGLMCAFYHEKEYGPSLARNQMVRDPFDAAYAFHVCQQCESPQCYFVCPKKGVALRVDKTTGVKYVNTSECLGCGSCSDACPFTPPRANVQPVKKVSFKCDLCRDRDQGPICVEYCTMHALRKVSGNERG
jgi:Fe-S-cluster-containing hydrogenase component 2